MVFLLFRNNKAEGPPLKGTEPSSAKAGVSESAAGC